MSLTASLIMIEGNYLSQVDGVLGQFHYRPTGNVVVLNSWSDMLDKINPSRGDDGSPSYTAALFTNGWTLIFDLESIISLSDERWSETSRRLKSRIFTMICADVLYAFCFYDGKLIREVMVGEGEIVHNNGAPLAEEKDIALDEFGELELMVIMQRLGVDYLKLEELHEFYIHELIGDSSKIEVFPAVAPLGASMTVDNSLKPWWRFW